MAELVDALRSGRSVLMDVEVRVLFWAPLSTFEASQRVADALNVSLCRSVHLCFEGEVA